MQFEAGLNLYVARVSTEVNNCLYYPTQSYWHVHTKVLACKIRVWDRSLCMLVTQIFEGNR